MSDSYAALVAYSHPSRRHHAGNVAAAAQAYGIAGASLIGGFLIQYAPFPTRLNFVTLIVILTILEVAVWHLPKSTIQTRKWKLEAPQFPRTLSMAFLAGATSVTTAYAIGAMILSVGAQVANEVIQSSNALINGATIAMFAAASAIATVAAKRFGPHLVVAVGSVVAVAASGSMAISAAHSSLALYIISQIGAGLGNGLLVLGGLALLNANTSEENRAKTLSLALIIAYTGQATVALTLGQVATASTIGIAVDVGLVAIVLCAVATVISIVGSSREHRACNAAIGHTSSKPAKNLER